MRIAFLIVTTAILATTLSAQTFTVLHNFELTDGQNPQGILINDSAGRLYGTTRFGGDVTNESEGSGVIFQLANSGSGWRESVLYKFSDGADGADPEDGLIAGPGGNGYGSASLAEVLPRTIATWTEDAERSIRWGAMESSPSSIALLAPPTGSIRFLHCSPAQTVRFTGPPSTAAISLALSIPSVVALSIR